MYIRMTGSPLLASGCIGDVQASKLTLWAGVPLVFERVQGNIQTMLRSKSPLIAGIYNWAYEYKKKWSLRGFKCRMMDKIFFKMITDKFGGNLKMVLTGGAPLMLG